MRTDSCRNSTGRWTSAIVAVFIPWRCAQAGRLETCLHEVRRRSAQQDMVVAASVISGFQEDS